MGEIIEEAGGWDVMITTQRKEQGFRAWGESFSERFLRWLSSRALFKVHREVDVTKSSMH